MRRGKRAAFVSIAAAVVIAAVSGGASSAGANRLDDTLRTNQVQVLATHNSYHIQQDVPIASSPTTQYTHAPLDQQLDLGVRGFELDVVNAARRISSRCCTRPSSTTRATARRSRSACR